MSKYEPEDFPDRDPFDRETLSIVAIADTHGNHEDVMLPEGDVLVHAGDFTLFSDGWEEFLDWFEAQEYEHKLLIFGNHETGTNEAEQYGNCDEFPRRGINFLGNGPVTIDGVKFGYVGSESVDVLVTHHPPKGILDEGRDRLVNQRFASQQPGSDIVHFGRSEYKLYVERHKPDFHLFGHVHSQYGDQKQNGTHFVNAALAGEGTYEIENKPVELEL